MKRIMRRLWFGLGGCACGMPFPGYDRTPRNLVTASVHKRG